MVLAAPVDRRRPIQRQRSESGEQRLPPVSRRQTLISTPPSDSTIDSDCTAGILDICG